MDGEARLAELRTVYGEVQKEAVSRQTGQAPRELPERILDSEVACVAESLGPRTQVLTGIPWVLPSGKLSDKGLILDRDLLGRFGYTANPNDHSRTYAYLTDVSHLWLGRTLDGKLRRPGVADKVHCAPWLERELQAMKPRVVVLMGRHAAPFFLKRFAGVHITKLQDAIAKPYDVTVGNLKTIAVPTLHPTGAQMSRGGSRQAYESTARAVAELLAT